MAVHHDDVFQSGARTARTKAALIAAFNKLFFASGFEAMQTSEIAREANVGRSTLYEHFAGKEALLAEAAKFLLEVLAEACVSDELPPELTHVFEHFWENRRRGLSAFSGAAGRAMNRQLTALIAERLPAGLLGDRDLAAGQLATAQLALLEAWLSGRHRASPGTFAAAFHAASSGAARGLAGQRNPSPSP